METKKLEEEISRIEFLLSKTCWIQTKIVWCEKQICINDPAIIKDRGILNLVGILYFTSFNEGNILMGQVMFLLDSLNKEVSYTTYFQKDSFIEVFSCWETCITLTGRKIKEILSNKQIKKPRVPAYLDSSIENLKDGFYCYLCDMAYYNCLCSHDDED